jgi:hypothetical protein
LCLGQSGSPVARILLADDLQIRQRDEKRLADAERSETLGMVEVGMLGHRGIFLLIGCYRIPAEVILIYIGETIGFG